MNQLEATPAGKLMSYLAGMYRIRYFEEKVLKLRLEGQIVGSVHLCIGQEAVAVGTLDALTSADIVFATYRGHGWAVACGVPLELLFAELLGRQDGVNAGRGGSAYFSAPQWGFYGENSIVGAGAPIATGAALAALYDQSNRVVICVFGDGAMNQGSVHEAMNFASTFNLPVVFVCENNKYSELTPIADMVRSDLLYQRAAAYAMPGERIDGNDPAAVRLALATACELARAGKGPTLIEAMTQRLVGHYVGDAEQYRLAGELEQLQKVEPVFRLRQYLIQVGVKLTELETLADTVSQEVEQAVMLALAMPLADVAKVKEHLYAGS